ncbi:MULTISPECIES: hypothetical protein [unclassified Neorhizobium]|uniref:hypothetical protein n=1 Tax=unclassified Neorhizobium TaxID=2629175 RepID=UPI001FF5EAED|nr:MULTISPECIES: hypothetical protein [unclassified Neorhizobium]MCJ9669445.1 hypothetical protein [Neorhizobium sp. SHOUNA12B]MCJ9745530.1 hypothetical protein [Neorhizobium sp. SHOUNA12A]
MTTIHDTMAHFVGNVVHHTLARRLFVLWTSKGASVAQIDEFFSSVGMELMNAHSDGTLPPEQEISLVDAMLKKLDDFESEVHTDARSISESLSHH